MLCDPPRIYPSLPEYTPFFKNYMRPSHNLPLPPRIYHHFQLIHMCDPPRIWDPKTLQQNTKRGVDPGRDGKILEAPGSTQGYYLESTPG